MKKAIFTLLLASLSILTWGQIGTKVSNDLRSAISNQTNPNEKYRIIITMNDRYDDVQMTRQTQYMTKAEKRTYVMNELQSFSSASQQNVLNLLNQGIRGGSVDDIHSFWLFNGITCEATSSVINEVAMNKDVNCIYLDHYAYRLPEDWNPEEGATEPIRGNGWNVTKVNADDVWSLGYTGSGVLVGLIDTGVKYTHTDIANNMWNGGSEYPNHGYDFHNNDNNPVDDNGHGTHCAGTISSYGTNGTQCGIAKNAKIMALKVLGSDGSGYLYTSWIAEEFAVSHGCDILSMSLGSDGLGPYFIERDILVNVMNCGVVASVAAGNVGDDLTTYPVPGNVGSPGNCPAPWGNPDQTNVLDGGHSACVTVGATTSTDGYSSFSSIGPVTWAEGDDRGDYSDYPYTKNSTTQIGLIKPDVAAPGSNIVSLNYSGTTGYSTKSGTSMATPCVAGVMALLLEVDPTLTPVEIDSILETTATHVGGYTSKNNIFGAGRVDALAAVNAILNACNAPASLTGTVDGCTVNLSWNAVSGISTYRVYRNGMVIASAVSGTSYSDSEAPAGHNSYYVRSNCSNGSTSESSNIVNVDIEVNAQIDSPSNLTATPNGTEVSLSWTAPTMRSANLAYTTTSSDTDGGDSETVFYFAQRYPRTMLTQYAGMQINKVYFLPGETGITYTVKIHKGDEMLPGEVVYTTSNTPSSTTMQEITLSSPLVMDPTQDYWLVISATGTMGYDEVPGCTEGFYYTYGDYEFYLYVNDIAWTMYMAISDAPYTYDIYRDSQMRSSQKIAEGVTGTSYTDHLFQAGSYEYTVTTVSNGYESKPSNSIQVEPGDIPQNNITYANVENGNISGPAQAAPGQTVTLTATPSSGYKFGSWNVYKTDNPTVTVNVTNNQFVMPNYDVTVSANFIEYVGASILTACGIEHGTITTNYASAEAGTTVTITATPDEGCHLSSIIIFNSANPDETITVNASNMTFTMPDYDVIISATFDYPTQTTTYQYEKVTSAPSNWAGEYLIVYSNGSKAFNGSLTTLDANNNSISVTISNNVIASTSNVDAATFTIEKASESNYTIKSKSGYYIGATSDNSNTLLSSTTTAYTNTLAYNNGNIDIKASGGAYLRFNTQNNRFRYYRSSQYTGQQAIQLYKKVAVQTTVNIDGPSLTVSPCELTGLDYTFDEGPSESQTVTIIPANLENDITVTAPSHYEVSRTLDGTYTASLTIPYAASQSSTTSYSFETGFEGWTTIDADGDGYNWTRSSVLMSGYSIPSHEGSDAVSSQSYDRTAGALTPDNYLVSPQVNLSSIASLTFWACAQDASYPAEHFGVAISTNGNTNASDFTTIQQWTLTAKSGGNGNSAWASRDDKGNRESGSWYQYEVDLSAYSGMGYIAIRHFNCSDEFYLIVDDITLYPVASSSSNAYQVFTRLKAGLAEGTYNETLQFTSGTATQSVDLEGTVTEATSAPWAPEGNEYEISMTLIGIIQINGVEQARATLEVGAFCGEECRGTQRAMLAPTGKYLVPMTIHGEANEEITFKLFDHLTETVLDYLSLASITVNEEGYGTLTSPYVLNFQAPYTFIGGSDNHEWGNLNNWEGGALPGENDYVIIDGDCEITTDIEIAKLVVDDNSTIVITDGNILTAGEIITTDPSQLIIEDCGQLYCNSEGVQATFHKVIEKNTDATDGWYTIASPINEPTIEHVTANIYDIYTYDEDNDQMEWQNYRVSEFQFTSGKGYLYANSAAIGEDNTDLIFKGTLTPGNATVEVNLSFNAVYEGIKGFNFLGNPYPHNISLSNLQGSTGLTIDCYYKIVNGTELVRYTDGVIIPGEGFFIKATEAGQSVIIVGE